jgi:GNAT superfamily N-acetyltransferase
MIWTREPYIITDEKERFIMNDVEALLRGTYWVRSRSREQMETSIANSLSLAILTAGSKQVGLARAVTDGVQSLLCDIVVHENHRGHGLGKWLVETLLNHDRIKHTRMTLVTKDAQKLYEKYGFKLHPYDCMIRYES